MAHITEEHLHHMARRHHATMQKLDGIRDRLSSVVQRSLGTLEMGAGSWVGGMLEGKTAGKTLGPVPLNLGIGVLLLAGGYANIAGTKYSDDLTNVGNGFISSWVAAMGYAFGKRWRETNRLFGGGDSTWFNPYDDLQRAAPNGAPNGGPAMPPPPTAGW